MGVLTVELTGEILTAGSDMAAADGMGETLTISVDKMTGITGEALTTGVDRTDVVTGEDGADMTTGGVGDIVTADSSPMCSI